MFIIETNERIDLGVVHPLRHPELELRLAARSPTGVGYVYNVRMENPEPHSYYPSEVLKDIFITTNKMGSGCTKCQSTPCKCYHGDKPMYILKGEILYKWDGKDWRGVNKTAQYISGAASIKELQSNGFRFPTEKEVDAMGGKESYKDKMERLINREPLWREEDLVPPIIKW